MLTVLQPLDNRWQAFWVSILVLFVLPFLPIIAELILKGESTLGAYTITIAVLVINVGFSSKSQFLLIILLFLGIVASICYGSLLLTNKTPEHNIVSFNYFTLGSTLISQLAERYRRHIINQEPFIVLDLSS